MSPDGINRIDEKFVCGNTKDKVFLLSELEVVKEGGFGFPTFEAVGGENPRIKFATDYALANFCTMTNTPGNGVRWWLRSPYYLTRERARDVASQGYARFTNIVNDLNPVEKVSYYDAIVFCNKLSIRTGKPPVYSVNDSTDPDTWNYTPHQNRLLEGKIKMNSSAEGYRLPTYDEWLKAYNGGKEYKWSGSDEFEGVAWVDANSAKKSKQIKTLASNNYGLYDMAGNVYEWIWLDKDDNNKFYCGGCFFEGADMATPEKKNYNYGSNQLRSVGFRIVCNKIEN